MVMAIEGTTATMRVTTAMEGAAATQLEGVMATATETTAMVGKGTDCNEWHGGDAITMAAT